jgi:dihydrofolate reductase
MRPLRYSINVSLDGCVDHAADGFLVDAESHDHAAAGLLDVDAIILGRTTYELMEYWKNPRPDLPDELQPFAAAMNATKKYLLSATREPDADWNAEALEGDPVAAVRALKQQGGRALAVGGVRLPRVLAEAGLIDEFEFVVHPVVVGHGPYLLDGLSHALGLEPAGVTVFASGVRAERFVARRS